MAARSGQYEMVCELLAAMDILDEDIGQAALYVAVFSNRTAVVRVLLDKTELNLETRYQMDYHNNQGTVLDIAIQEEELPMVKLLLSRGALIQNPGRICAFFEKCDNEDPDLQDAVKYACQQLIEATRRRPPSMKLSLFF